MFFRGRQPETSIWKRFRGAADGFMFVEEKDYFMAHLVANAERVVDLSVALLDYMPPAVDVAIQDARTGRSWSGERLALPDVRDELARIKTLLAAHGGVEIAVFTSEDQITVNAVLELFIYSRTDHWLYILRGKGLEERRLVRTRSWRLNSHEFPDAPELSSAVVDLAETLKLSPA
jgi:hypothetical protein